MQIVVRALAVLRQLSGRQSGMSLQELSDALEASPATVHRLMAVMVTEHFVVRDPVTKRYTMGPAALSLARDVRHLAEVARPYLEKVSAATEETAFLTELVGPRAVCVALVEGTRPLRLFVRVGQEMPLHAAASARSLVAFMGDDEVSALLADRELVAFTPETPATPAAVASHLREVRELGYDVCDNELDVHVWAVGVPIRSADGQVVASLTVAAPTERAVAAQRRRTIQLALDAADELSAALGYLPALDQNSGGKSR